jgi:hypothetical protein
MYPVINVGDIYAFNFSGESRTISRTQPNNLLHRKENFTIIAINKETITIMTSTGRLCLYDVDYIDLDIVHGYLKKMAP